MQSLKRTGTHAARILLASAVGLAISAEAQEPEQTQQREHAESSSDQPHATQRIAAAERGRESEQPGASLETWSQMEGDVLHAEQLLDGEVSNGVNPIGSVADLVLSEDGSRIEFILYEVPYPFSFYGAEDGFSTFEDVDIFRDASLDFEVRLPIRTAPQGPEELQLSAADAEQRLVSRIIGERLYFSEEISRRIEDLLIDRETGEILHYVVETDPEAIFSADLRTVPAEQISIDDSGQITASIELAALDEVQEFDSDLL